jgi:cell wall-associated NlpC family hydrolase
MSLTRFKPSLPSFLVGFSPDMMIPFWVARFIGIPWRDGGRTFEGCDCYGLAVLVFRQVWGVELPSYAGSYTSPRERDEVAILLQDHIPTDGWRLVDGEQREGDGVVFRLLNAPWHVGLIVAPGIFLHVEESVGASCLERLDGHRWARRLLGIYRHPMLSELAQR